MKFLLLAVLVAVATAAPGPIGPVPAPNPDGPDIIEYFEPVSIGPVIVEGFGPFTVGAAKVDTPVGFSSSSPNVNIDVIVDAAPGAIVNVYADACASGRALGVEPLIVGGFGPITVGDATVDTPVDFSSSSRYVNINVKVTAASGSIVTVHADGRACGRALGVEPLIVEGLGPITVGAATVDTPVDFSSSSPYVNINVKVDTASGAVVNVFADACASGRALGVEPLIVEDFGPITDGAAKVDTPVDFSSSSSYVNINVNVNAASGSVVKVHADASACGRALGVAPVSPESIPPV